MLANVGITLDKKILSKDDVSYEYYLGPNYRNEKSTVDSSGRVSKRVAPHVSIFDVQVMGLAFAGDVSFVAGAFLKDVPFLGSLCKTLGCVLVPRGGNKEQLGDVLTGLMNRTELIEAGASFPCLTIFPEGTCTNNSCLIKYRRGAFYDLRAVTPVTIKYKFGMVSPAIDALEMSYMVFLVCACLQNIVAEVYELPPLEPNDYLFKKHSDKGTEKWEIFAWATRDVMSKVGGFG